MLFLIVSFYNFEKIFLFAQKAGLYVQRRIFENNTPYILTCVGLSEIGI